MNPPDWFTDIRHFQLVVDAIMRIPMTMIFQEGEVYGRFEDLKSPRLQKSMSRKLKGFISIEPFKGEPRWLDGCRIAYLYYEHSSRKRAYRKRMTLKSIFPKHRGILKYARCMSQKDFLSKIDMTEDFSRALKHQGFRDARHLWQVCNNLKLPIPQPQKSLTEFCEVSLNEKTT